LAASPFSGPGPKKIFPGHFFCQKIIPIRQKIPSKPFFRRTARSGGPFSRDRVPFSGLHPASPGPAGQPAGPALSGGRPSLRNVFDGLKDGKKSFQSGKTSFKGKISLSGPKTPAGRKNQSRRKKPLCPQAENRPGRLSINPGP
jgi:hypothetical protein